MRLVRSFFAIAILVTASAAIAQEQEPKPVQPPLDTSLVEMNDRFNEGIVNADVEAMLRLYAEDTLWIAPGAPLEEGLSAPEASYRFVVEQGAKLSHSVEKTLVADDRSLAIMIGRYRLRAPKTDIADDGSYLFVLTPKGDSWAIAVDMFNSDRPRQEPSE